jgi:hypothetical protein
MREGKKIRIQIKKITTKGKTKGTKVHKGKIIG